MRHPGNEIGFPSPLTRGRVARVQESGRKTCHFTIDKNRSNTSFPSSQRGSPSGD
jgi:hypothetical protein